MGETNKLPVTEMCTSNGLCGPRKVLQVMITNTTYGANREEKTLNIAPSRSS